MRRLISTILLILAGFGMNAQTQDYSPLQEHLKQHIYFLASDSLGGRDAGSKNGYKAALYVQEQYKRIGLQPVFKQMMVPFEGCQTDYSSSVGGEMGERMDSAMAAVTKGKYFNNIIAIIPGNDPKLRYEFIVIGAHYDHLGIKNGQVYNGADDNASGTAAVIEMARILKQRQSELKRSVIICGFDAEEKGLCGSNALATLFDNGVVWNQLMKNIFGITNTDANYSSDNIKLMMSIDMVGWYRQSGHLILEGTGTLDGGKSIAGNLAKQHDINVSCKGFENSIFTATDTEPFARLGVPTLAITTGLKSPYHKPEDDADLIDYKGLEKVVNYLTDLTLLVAQNGEVQPSGRLAPKHSGHRDFFEMGLTLGFGRQWYRFSDANLTSDSRLGWHGGVNALLNISRRFFLLGQAEYHVENSYISTLDLSNNTLSLDATNHVRQKGFLLPVGIFYNLVNMSGIDIFLGAGAYYKYETHTNHPAPLQINNPWGWHWGVCMRTGNLSWMIQSRYQINNLLNNSGAPRIKSQGVDFSLTWYLW